MNTISRLMTNICSDNLVSSKEFYTTLFDFEVAFESDWFISLVSKDKRLELGIIDMNNELVPLEYQNKPTGFYITLVVDDVEEVFQHAKKENYTVLSDPQDTFYGQRRLLLQDPNGALVDVSSVI